MSPIKRMTSAFSSAGDRSSRVPGGDMPLQNLKSLYAESPDLPIFTRAVSPCPPRLPPAKPPLPGLLPLLRLTDSEMSSLFSGSAYPCNKVTTCRKLDRDNPPTPDPRSRNHPGAMSLLQRAAQNRRHS